MSAARPVRVTVDLVIFTIRETGSSGRSCLAVLLTGRSDSTAWSLPGGPIRHDEPLEQAARRHLAEKTDVGDIYLEQLYTFGDPSRDPNARTLSVAYFALIGTPAIDMPADRVAATHDGAWHPVLRLPALDLDHRQIIDYAVSRLRNKLEYTTVGFQLLPRSFTLTELQRVYEIILEKSLDKRNFRKKMLSLGILRPLPELAREGAGRPARRFAFNEQHFASLKEKGILFPF